MASKIERGFFNKFNRGEVSKDAFAREDVAPIENAAEQMENFMPERLGPMSYRPGSEYIEDAQDVDTITVPFTTAIDEDALLVFSGSVGTIEMKIIEDDEYVDRPATTSTLINDDFELTTLWTNADEGSATSTIDSGNDGQLKQTGTGFDAAIVHQTLSTFQASVQHCLQVWVRKHKVTLQIGTSGVSSIDIFSGELYEGWHEISFTPGVTAPTITISNSDEIQATVEQCVLVNATVDIDIDLETIFNFVQLGTPGGAVSLADMRSMQFSQAGNEMYVTGRGFIPFIVRRWNSLSWSVEKVRTLFGPYEPINVDGSLTLDPSLTGQGDIPLIASKDLFVNPENELGYETGTAIKIATTGQLVSATGSADDVATDPVFIFGTGNARKFELVITVNSGAGWTVWLEKSFDEITYVKVETYTTAQDIQYDDGLDGAEVFYRLRIETAGTANLTMELDYSYGTLEAEGHIYELQSSLQANAAFYSTLSNQSPTADWYIGSWGGQRKYPRANCFYEGRWWTGGNNKVWGSESDFYNSFDRLLEGASASIEKTVGFASSDEVLWLAPSSRLVIGTAKGELDVRSDAFGAVLSQANVNIKAGSDLGAAAVIPITLDTEIIFVQRGGNKLIGIDFSIDSEKHNINDFTLLNPDILKGGPAGTNQCVRLAYSRNPEPRVYCVLDNGDMAVLLRDAAENVLGWSIISAPGTREYVDVSVLPKTGGDAVYVVVKDGSSAWIEKFAQYDECIGGSRSRHFDAHVSLTSPGTTITGLNHIDGEEVGVWVDGVDDGDYTVSSNQITGVTSGTDVVVGLRYVADYKSNKLTDYSDVGVLNQYKRVINTGLIMRNYVPGVITIGPPGNLDNLPALEEGKAPAYGDYDFFAFEHDGISETDPRVAIRATGPCKIGALAYDVKNTAHKTPERSG